MDDPPVLEIFVDDFSPGPYETAIKELEVTPPSPSKTTLMTLPNEILLTIVDFVLGASIRRDGHDYFQYSFKNIQDIRRVCLVLYAINQRFLHLLTPLLYTVVTNRGMQSLESVKWKILEAPPFMQDYIRYIDWDNGLEYSQNMQDVQEIIADMCAFFGLLPIVDADFDESLASLLQSTPDLRYLSITEKNTSMRFDGSNKAVGPVWLRYMAQSALSRIDPPITSGFQHLHSLRISMDSTSLEFISGVLPLPSLRHLELSDIDNGFEDNAVPEEDWNCPPRASPITHLYILRSFVDSPAVAQLVSSMKGLEHFELQFYFRRSYALIWWATDEHRAFPKMHYPDLGDVVREQKSTLKTLKVLAITNTSDLVFCNVNTGSLGTLNCLHKLEVFKGTFQALFQKSTTLGGEPEYHLRGRIPTSITDLELYTEFMNAVGELNALNDILEVCLTSLPNLAKISVYHRAHDVFINQRGSILAEEFQKKGVELRFQKKY